MIIKNMTVTNNRGDFIEFGLVFKLMSDFSLSGTKAKVNYSDNNLDGSIYQNTILENKDFQVQFYIQRNNRDSLWTEEQRELAYKVFNPKNNPFRIDFETVGGKQYYINANLETVVSFPTGRDNQNLGWQKGLLQFSANEPFFYEKDSKKVDVATWEGNLEFNLELVEGGIEFGYRTQSLIANCINDGGVNSGMIIQFKAVATVVNPSLININTYEELKLNTTMIANDLIEISTYSGNKSITLTRNEIKTNIFNVLDLSSTFLQLKPGDNLFRYNAEEGINSLDISMIFNNKYVGV